MKVFLENYNGVLDSVEDFLREKGQLTANPHEADVFLTWQDIRGDFKQLADIVKYHLKKPLVVMQHGRGATRDYGPPNNFKMLADKILVWGESEEQRLLKYGIPKEKIEIVGCPHFHRLKTKPRENEGKNILFVPVIAQKEEPENLLVFGYLKKWESEKLIENVTKQFDKLKKSWLWQHEEYKEVPIGDGKTEKRLWKRHIRPILPRWVTYHHLVNVKLAGIHDPYQYQAPQMATPQNHPNLIDDIADMLPQIDVVVGLEEGTLQLCANYLDIPCIIVDIFKYKNYGGCADYDRIEKIKTKACYWTKNPKDLGMLLESALNNPKKMSEHRKAVCEFEGGSKMEGDHVSRVIGTLESLVQRSEGTRVKEAVC